MIRAVKEWLLSVVMLSFLISLLRLLLPEGNLRKVGAFTGSLVLTAAILRPLARLEPQWPEWDWERYENAIAERTEELGGRREEAFRAEVEARSAELVRAKAEELGLTVSAVVTARTENGTPLPWGVRLDAPRNAALSEWLYDALNIPPERQQWADGEP